MAKIRYFIKIDQYFDSIPEAYHYLDMLKSDINDHNAIDVDTLKYELKVTFQMPRPEYKSWVPRWLILLISKYRD